MSSISFNTIPESIRVPLFWAEMDNSKANKARQAKRALILGQTLATGSAVAGTPYIITSVNQAIALFGHESMLVAMVNKYRKSDLMGEMWVIPQAEPPAGVAATGTITVTGPATSSGTIALYVGAQVVYVLVLAGDSATVIATAIATAINAVAGLPVAAASAAAVVTNTCRWKGLTGNDLVVQHSFRGVAGGEQLPAGVGLTCTPMTGGTGVPSLGASIAAMGDEEYDYIVSPYTDAASLDALRDELSTAAGRWSYARQIYGHVYTALRGTVGSLVTAGLQRNDEHNSLAGFETDVPNPAWEYAAAYGARNAVFLNAKVSRPTQTGELVEILPPRQGKRFTALERQMLLNNRIATSYYSGGVQRVERAITTYGVNPQGQPDDSYLDSETMHQSAEFLRRMRAVSNKFGRHSLADNGTPIQPGSGVVTPAVLAGEYDAEYLRMVEDGLCENFELWQRYRRVERNPNNPNRVDVFFAPDYVNQLRIIAAINQFQLQYAPALAEA